MSETQPNTEIESGKSWQCRHIFTDGHQCGSRALRKELFCYYHHKTRKTKSRLKDEDEQWYLKCENFNLPYAEDRAAIQHSINEILRCLAFRVIEPKQAGLMLYGLQIASQNLSRMQDQPKPAQPAVELCTDDPDYGSIAPETEWSEPLTIQAVASDPAVLWTANPGAPGTGQHHRPAPGGGDLLRVTPEALFSKVYVCPRGLKARSIPAWAEGPGGIGRKVSGL